jgi:signal transduction histidine kinase
MDETNQLPFGSRLLRYFIHGVAFSTLFLVLAIIWIFVFFLVIIGSFLGILIGIVVLFFFIGGLNTFLTRWIWSADIRSDLLSLFIHGVGLFVALLIASLPMFFLIGTPYSLALLIVLFLPYAIIDGFIAKNIAFALREHTEPVFSTNVPSERAADQDTEIEHGTPKESSVEDEAVEAGRLYDKLLAKYVNHWGYQTGTRILNDEIAAHTRHGDSFAEAVRKVYQRQEDS